jgi:hypothetical protein
LEKNYRFENKAKHLKGIDQSLKGKVMMGKTSKNKWKNFKKTLKRMERNFQSNTKTQLYGLL